MPVVTDILSVEGILSSPSKQIRSSLFAASVSFVGFLMTSVSVLFSSDGIGNTVLAIAGGLIWCFGAIVAHRAMCGELWNRRDPYKIRMGLLLNGIGPVLATIGVFLPLIAGLLFLLGGALLNVSGLRISWMGVQASPELSEFVGIEQSGLVIPVSRRSSQRSRDDDGEGDTDVVFQLPSDGL